MRLGLSNLLNVGGRIGSFNPLQFTSQATSTFGLNVYTSTGYFAIDMGGYVDVYSEGGISLTDAGTYSIWSCAGLTDDTPSGDVEHFESTDGLANLSALSFNRETKIEYASVISNPLLTYLDLSRLNSALTLSFYDNGLTQVDLPLGLTGLDILDLGLNYLTYVDISGIEANRIYLQENQLEEVVAVGSRTLGYYYSPYYYEFGFNLGSNNLDGEALDSFYSDIGPSLQGSPTGSINVANNPGINDHTPSIATLKGYIVYVS
jgi:hypothetical protein